MKRTSRDVMHRMLRESDDDPSMAGNEVEGGVGDDARVRDFCYCQIVAGIAVEMEHTDDAGEALEITLDHLTEDPYYYSTVIPFDEVKAGLLKAARTVRDNADKGTVGEAMTSGNVGGFSQTSAAMGQPGSGYLPQDEPSPLNRKKRKKKKKSKKD